MILYKKGSTCKSFSSDHITYPICGGLGDEPELYP